MRNAKAIDQQKPLSSSDDWRGPRLSRAVERRAIGRFRRRRRKKLAHGQQNLHRRRGYKDLTQRMMLTDRARVGVVMTAVIVLSRSGNLRCFRTEGSERGG